MKSTVPTSFLSVQRPCYNEAERRQQQNRKEQTMEELRQTIQEHGIRYQLEGDYYLPVLELPEENRPIGRWGWLHKAYLKNYRPILYQSLLLSGKLYTVLADLNEQATERCRLIIRQMAETEGITEELKANNPMCWVQAMNSIRSRAEEIIRAEMIYC